MEQKILQPKVRAITRRKMESNYGFANVTEIRDSGETRSEIRELLKKIKT